MFLKKNSEVALELRLKKIKVWLTADAASQGRLLHSAFVHGENNYIFPDCVQL